MMPTDNRYISFNQVILLFFLLISTFAFAQEPHSYINDYDYLNKNTKGVKKITVKENDTIQEQHYFNNKGLIYFFLKNRLNHVGYFKYDKKNRLIKKINAYAIQGFSCEEIKYSDKSTQLFSYLTEDEKQRQLENDKYLENKSKGIEYTIVGQDTISIDDAYSVVTSDEEYYKYKNEIEGIKDTTALLNTQGLKKLINQPKYLDFSIEYDSKLRPLNEKFFDSRNNVTSVHTFSYLPGKIINKYKTDMIGMGEIIKTFDEHKNIISEKEGSKNLKYKYKDQHCIEKSEFKNDTLLNTTTYNYDNNLLSESIYRNLEDGNVYFSNYKYNSKNLITEIIFRYQQFQRVYKYEYEYYK